MTQLTNEMILADLNPDTSYLTLHVEQYTTVTILFLALTIVLFAFKKTRRYCIGGIIASVFFVVSTLQYRNQLDYTTYAIQNNTWSVVVDTVVDREYKLTGGNNHGKYNSFKSYYYLYLKDNGKVSVNSQVYLNTYEGDSFYVILLEDEKGNKHLGKKIYSLKEYVYNNE